MWIIPIILKIVIVSLAMFLYMIGEASEVIGFTKKEFKYIMGIIPAICGTVLTYFQGSFSLFPMWAVLTYFGACWIFGYGDKHPITWVIGKRNAITLHGAMVGFAAYPLIGLWCILGGIVSGLGFRKMAEWDDAGWFKEPLVAIGRSFVGMIVVIGYYVVTVFI